MKKHQTSNTKKTSNIQTPKALFVIWCFLGVWFLVFGVSSSALAQSDASAIRFNNRTALAAVQEYPALPLDKDLISSVYWYELLPATGNKLASSATLDLSYAAGEARWREIFIYNSELGTWQHLPGNINLQKNQLAAQTNWASGFVAVFADRLSRSEYLKERINSPTILVMDAKTGQILAERESTVVRPIASLTKLATAAVFLEHNPGWKAAVAMRPEDDAIPAKISVRPGDVFTSRDLFYATLVKSANNAAKALARSTGLKNGSFVAAMNEKAKTLGMERTRFVEPTGLSAGNVSTAQDYAKLASAVFADPLFLQATTPKTYTIATASGKRQKLVNSNKLLDVPYVVIGSKTGFTNEAGRCLVMKVRNSEGREIIAITMGADTPGAQWDDMRMLLDAALGGT
ncbi:MAG: D-alanyl-D-alanine carboxypeptidase [Parcubacteria group bacterium]|nr:D-alanyl-D-alanine carboxypeptidase [Parcubacteria group bacterium]